MKCVSIVLGMAVFAVGSSALAAEGSGGPPSAPAARESKVRVGLRVGYALPLGVVDSWEYRLSRDVNGQLSTQLDAGYMVTPNLMLGAYARYGIVSLKSPPMSSPRLCDTQSCSGSDIGFGVHAQYHFSPHARQDPWLGLGAGYEVLSAKGNSPPDSEVVTRFSGFEFAQLQGGLDLKTSSWFTVGPFVSVSFAEFAEEKTSYTWGPQSRAMYQIDSGSSSFSTSVEDKRIHEWLTLGVKGTFGIQGRGQPRAR